MAARRSRSGVAAALFAIAIGLVANSADASPVDTFGFGSRSTAMGGAVAADVKDFSANYYNPAALVSAEGLRIDVGYVHAFHQLKINGHDNDVDPFRALEFGIVAPGNVAGLPFAFGIGLHLPDDRVFRVRSLDQSQPRWEMYDNRTQRIFLAANLAIQPFPWLQVGGGLSFLAQTRVSLDITGLADVNDPSMSYLRHEVDADLTSIRYPQAGILITPRKDLRFAAVYRGEFQLDINIAAHIAMNVRELSIEIPFLSYLTTATTNAFLPKQAVVGGSWDVSSHVTLDADLTWVNWSAYKNPVTRVTANTTIDAPPGFPKSLLPENPAATVVSPPQFRDRIVPRVGVEWRIPLARGDDPHELAVRGGYFYEKSPIPNQSAGTNFVDTDRHAFSAGVGIKLTHLGSLLPGDLHFDTHAMLSVLPERTMTKSSAADLVGDYTAKGTIWLVGATMGVVFK